MWKKYFKTPFINGHDIYVYDADYHPVANYLVNFSHEECEVIVGIINGDVSYQKEYKITLNENKTKVLADETPILLMRGWGYLTGTGGCNLKVEEAIDVQNSLAEYIVEQFNNKK